MTCPCGHHFCWYCYKDHPSGTIRRVYHLHSVPECAFIFISKIVIFLACVVSLLITFNGNGIIKTLFSILGAIFSVVWRAVIIDGFILSQILVFMMQKRRRFSRPNSYSLRSYIIFAIIANVIGIGLLLFFGELSYFMQILFGELLLACLGFAIGYGVIYSIETWF